MRHACAPAYATRPTLGVAIIAAIAAACFSPEGEEERRAAERVREARVLRAAGLAPQSAQRPAPAREAITPRAPPPLAEAAEPVSPGSL